MSWLITGTQKTLNGTLTLGQSVGGGYFAGYISHTADGNPTHALIVAPRATGATGTGYTLTTNLAWKTSNTSTTGTSSMFDGAANTAAMVTAGIVNHPAAQFCVGLNIGSFTDWYLPSYYELDIAYQELKPTIAANTTSFGINPYSVPKRTSNRTAVFPGQTSILDFNTTTQGFTNSRHWCSTENDANSAWDQNWNDGNFFAAANFKTGASFGVRAFRRIAL